MPLPKVAPKDKDWFDWCGEGQILHRNSGNNLVAGQVGHRIEKTFKVL